MDFALPRDVQLEMMNSSMADSANPSENAEPVRMDVWLWCVRAYRTRPLASAACTNGQVTVRGQAVKPSRKVRIGEEIQVEKPFLVRTLKVVGVLTRRVGASLVAQYCEDLTPPEEIEAARKRAYDATLMPSRAAGSGRPTKKERREVEDVDDLDFEDEGKRQELFEKLMRQSGF